MDKMKRKGTLLSFFSKKQKLDENKDIETLRAEIELPLQSVSTTVDLKPPDTDAKDIGFIIKNSEKPLKVSVVFILLL